MVKIPGNRRLAFVRRKRIASPQPQKHTHKQHNPALGASCLFQLLLGAELVAVTALPLTAVGGTRGEAGLQ